MSYKKQIFKLGDLKKFLTEENSCVSLMPTVRLLALPPFFLNDMKSGILYLLNTMLKKYDRSLGGIVIGYQNIKILMDENTGVIPIGTSETEVNISVEFYIFQPRIGSYLEGIVNKKSNNHIGCLVHRYFNATILKPDDIDYEDWVCKNFNVDDKIIFKVKDLDFTSLLPYIEGVIDNETLMDNSKCNMHKNCDTDDLMINNHSKIRQNEISLANNFLRHKITLDENSDNNLLENKKVKSKKKKVNTLEDNVDKDLERIDSLKNLKKKKRKKDKEEKKLSVSVDLERGENFNDEKVTSNTIITNEADERQLIKKKKRKKKSDDIGRDDQEHSAIFENAIECLSSSKMEDNILYSTLLNPIQSEKMKISFYSPIPQGTPVGRKKGETSLTTDLDSTVSLSSQNESAKKEKKKKQRKRKREEKESEDFSIPKKMKTSHIISSEKGNIEGGTIDDDKSKLEVQTVMEQFYNQQLNKVKEAIHVLDKDSRKEEKKEKKKLKKREKEVIHSKIIGLNKNTAVQINGAGDIEKTEAQSNKLELEKELNISEKQSSKGNKRTNIKVNNRKEIFEEKMRENSLEVNNISNDQKYFTNKEEKKSEVQNILDELLKQEMDKVKNNFKDSDADSVREEKEIKTAVNKQETVIEGSHLSLYEKLLKEAKNAMDLDRDKPQSLLRVKELRKNKSKNIKDSDLSDFSTSSSKKKNSGKKKKHKEKTDVYHKVPDKYRNGSMYDASAASDNINFDRSLFSDSEQSSTSPVKKLKKTNGIETKLGKSLVQNMLGEFCKEGKKRLQSESDKESLISLKKQEKKKSTSERKSQNPNEEKESLYEKLLKEAKSLMDSKEQSSPKKRISETS